MPFRCLSYVAELLNSSIKDKNKLYFKGLIRFPAPKFFVLYDGNSCEPLQRKMRLSDAFGGNSDSLELVVTAFNINHGLPQPLLQRCPYLSDYSTLVGKVKEGIRLSLSRCDAIIRAVKFCLAHGIMGNYLIEHSKEVFNMLALEWNMDDALQARFEEGRNEGREEGREEGRNEGREEGREIVAVKLIRRGRPFDEIQEDTGLTLQRLEQLAKKIF